MKMKMMKKMMMVTIVLRRTIFRSYSHNIIYDFEKFKQKQNKNKNEMQTLAFTTMNAINS